MAIDMKRRPPPRDMGPVVRALRGTVQPVWKLGILVVGFLLAYLLLGLYGALFSVVIFFGGQLVASAWDAREERKANEPRASMRGIKPVIRSTPRKKGPE